MKKIIAITAVILFGCLFVSSFYATQNIEPNAEQTIVYNEKQTENTDAEINTVYILKAENGEIVVYRKGEAAPYLQTGSAVGTLPKGDILRLEQGIEVSGEEKLKKLLEDYCS